MDPSLVDYAFLAYLHYDICTMCREAALQLDMWGNPYDTDL